MIQLGLLRHGHTEWNRAGRIQGRSDIPLDQAASQDLSGLSLPPEWQNAMLVASPLDRAQHTAQLVTGRQPQTEDALIEMHWGEWEGQQGLILKSDPDSGFRDIEDWGWDYRPPGGESPADVWARLSPWISALRVDTIAVTHIGIMRVLMARATGWDFKGPAPFQIKRNRLFVLNWDGQTLRAEPETVRLLAKGA